MRDVEALQKAADAERKELARVADQRKRAFTERCAEEYGRSRSVSTVVSDGDDAFINMRSPLFKIMVGQIEAGAAVVNRIVTQRIGTDDAALQWLVFEYLAAADRALAESGRAFAGLDEGADG